MATPGAPRGLGYALTGAKEHSASHPVIFSRLQLS